MKILFFADIERYSKILKILERDYQDNKDTAFCIKVLQGQGGSRFKQWLQSVFYNFKISYEDVERYSKILKILERDHQDNEDTVFCIKVLQGQGGSRFEQWLQSVFYNFKISYEGIERYSKILKILERDYQDNVDTVFCIKVSQGQGDPRFKQLLQSVV